MMRYLILTIALISTLCAVDWPSDYDEAKEQAKKEKKNIYMLIGSEYCPWCEKFEKKVLSQKEVIEKLEKDYVLIYLSREIDDIPTHLEKTPVPRHYFLTENGEIIYTIVGYRSVEALYEVLNDVKEENED
ncbi:thioredoxin family protein [Sulfurimonas sp.]|uniref:thioredoxin family protein n=1 Tax=Sulfurimonas sp. TaxID=2022749 RepID=UPI002626F958|nr:thioredoxin family protein [Sulfurimonas sp.]MCW8896136.1 thioredoxin family protein [Sulfurimonas sp.]MCW9068493.1 thioredoxin family protein [Sulfurimonas sp.]